MVSDLSVANIGEQEDYQRVQRARARKVSALLERKDTINRLKTASIMIGPVEKIMRLCPKC